MKINIILALCLATFTLTNCSKDNKTLIIGKWTANSYTETQYKNNLVEKIEVKYFSRANTLEFKEQVSSQGTVTVTDDLNIETGDYLMMDTAVNIWTPKSGNTSYSIKSLSSNELSLVKTKTGSTNEYKEYLTKYTR